MGTWRVPADVMANGRFAITPMAEVVGALGALTRPRTPDQRAFREAHGAAFADWVASRPGAADLVAASFRDARPGVAGWMADYLSMPPETEDATFDEGLEVLRRLSDEDVRADLRETTQAPLAPSLMTPGVREVVLDLVVWLWTHTLQTDWGRRERILRADIVSRTAQLARHGWGTVLRDLGRDREWVGDGQLRINRYDLPTRTLAAGSQLLFVPTHTDGSWVGWDADRYAVYYPVAGRLARVDAAEQRRPGPVGRREPGRGAGAARRPAQHLPARHPHRPGDRVGRRAPQGAARGRRGAAAPVGPRGPLLADRARRRAGGRGRLTAVLGRGSAAPSGSSRSRRCPALARPCVR